MSYEFRPFARWHASVVLDDGTPLGGVHGLDHSMLRTLEREQSVTLFADELPVACGGVTPLWPGRHMAWALISNQAGAHMLPITRMGYQIVHETPGRVEITVRKDFAAGHRWAKMIGFEMETPLLRAYGPDGEDHVGYVRVNGR